MLPRVPDVPRCSHARMSSMARWTPTTCQEPLLSSRSTAARLATGYAGPPLHRWRSDLALIRFSWGTMSLALLRVMARAEPRRTPRREGGGIWREARANDINVEWMGLVIRLTKQDMQKGPSTDNLQPISGLNCRSDRGLLAGGWGFRPGQPGPVHFSAYGCPHLHSQQHLREPS